MHVRPFFSIIFSLSENQPVYKPNQCSPRCPKREDWTSTLTDLNTLQGKYCILWASSLCCLQSSCPQNIWSPPSFLPGQPQRCPLRGPCTKKERKSLHWRSMDITVSPGQTQKSVSLTWWLNWQYLHLLNWQHYVSGRFKVKMASMGYLFLC